MLTRRRYSPVSLNEHEQVVLAVESRLLPNLTETLLIILFAPALLLIPLVVFHRFFRPMTYLITTERILIVEPKGVLAEIDLDKISKTRSTKTSLMVHAGKQRLWLSRIPDAWFFEAVVWKVHNKVNSTSI